MNFEADVITLFVPEQQEKVYNDVSEVEVSAGFIQFTHGEPNNFGQRTAIISSLPFIVEGFTRK